MQNKLRNKILVVAESIDVEDSSGSKANVALVYNLKKAGFEVIVYHYTRKKIQLKGIKCVAIKENRHSFLFFLSRTERVLRHRLNIDLHKPLEKIFGFSFTLFNDRNSIASGLREIKDFEPDLVLTLSKGGSFRPHHALLKLPEWHSRWMAYIHDPYPAHLFPRPFAWVEPGYYKKWKFVKDVSEKAAFSAFPSKLLMEWMGSYFPRFLKTGVVIPHQIGKDEPQISNLPFYFEKKKFNLLHAGTLLGPRNPIPLLTAFHDFLTNNPEAKNDTHLIFIGNNEHYSSPLDSFSKKLSSNLIVRSYTEHKLVLEMQKESSVNIILEAKSEISPFLPGKFPHCVIAEKPILLLGPYYSESKRLLGEDYPFWAEVDDVEKISLLLGELYNEWKYNPDSLKLNRPDLVNYLSSKNLKIVIDNLMPSEKKR